MNSPKKPFKLVSYDRRIRKGVVVGSLEELVLKAKDLYSLSSDPIKIVLEEDGTEIVEDDYLLFLNSNTKLMILQANQEWTDPIHQFDVTDHSGAGKLNYNPVTILQKLVHSPGSIALLSEEELQVASSFDDQHWQHIGVPQKEVEYLIEACERELERKTRLRDAIDLIDLYQKAKQSNTNP